MIGLCIKHQHENYGGILQAFATVGYFEKCHIDYELVRYRRKKTFLESIRDIPRVLNPVWFNSRYEGIQRKVSLRLHRAYAKNNAIRMQAFARFKTWAFRRFSEEYVGYQALCTGGKKYTAVVTGSDQLWSPAGLPTNYYNLMFVPDEILKISIASSFGVKEIPWYQKKRTKQFLNRIEHISMRENRGSEIVRELTGRDVPTILDPVFLFSAQEWLERIPNVKEITEPYVFVYFLGKNPEYRKQVERFAGQTGLKIVTLRHMDQYVAADESFGDIAPYDVDPGQFLNLLRNAQYVFTDSFHGAAFSVINQKQFIVFDRYREESSVSKNSRIDTLCQNFGLEDRRYCTSMDIMRVVERKIDYSLVNKRLDRQRRLTDLYMNRVVNELKSCEQSNEN